MRILGICGSLRRGSYNRRLLRAAIRLAPAGVELAEWDGLGAVPPFNQDDEDTPPPAVQDLCRAIAAADAVLVATPEYNSSLPGQLKNALDWLSRPSTGEPLRGKPVAVIGASTSMFGAVWSQAELRKVLSAMGARVSDRELAVPHASEQLADDARLLDPGLRHKLEEVMSDLVVASAPRDEARAA